MVEKIIEQMPIRSLWILLFASFFVDLYVFIITKKGANYPNKSGSVSKCMMTLFRDKKVCVLIFKNHL